MLALGGIRIAVGLGPDQVLTWRGVGLVSRAFRFS